MTTTLKSIGPLEADRLMKSGARLVDIRGPDEHSRERIDTAMSGPLDTLTSFEGDAPVIFHCRSGRRTRANATQLANSCQGPVYVLEGGIDAWKAAGLPVVNDTKQPIEIMRQVQISGGLVILLSVLLTLFVSPSWALLGGAVGIGMLHAGLTGSCAMTRLLEPMPWNRRHAI